MYEGNSFEKFGDTRQNSIEHLRNFYVITVLEKPPKWLIQLQYEEGDEVDEISENPKR